MTIHKNIRTALGLTILTHIAPGILLLANLLLFNPEPWLWVYFVGLACNLIAVVFAIAFYCFKKIMDWCFAKP